VCACVCVGQGEKQARAHAHATREILHCFAFKKLALEAGGGGEATDHHHHQADEKTHSHTFHFAFVNHPRLHLAGWWRLPRCTQQVVEVPPPLPPPPARHHNNHHHAFAVSQDFYQFNSLHHHCELQEHHANAHTKSYPLSRSARTHTLRRSFQSRTAISKVQSRRECPPASTADEHYLESSIWFVAHYFKPSSLTPRGINKATHALCE
jgi:hypothetical protein